MYNVEGKHLCALSKTFRKHQGPHVQRLAWISYWNLPYAKTQKLLYAQMNSDLSKCVYAWIRARFFCTSRSTWNWAHKQRWQTPPCSCPHLNMQIYLNRPWTWDSPLSDQIKQASVAQRIFIYYCHLLKCVILYVWTLFCIFTNTPHSIWSIIIIIIIIRVRAAKLSGTYCIPRNSSSSSKEVILPMGENSPNFAQRSSPMPDSLNSKDMCPPLLGGAQ